jgi:hypothetical protein
VNRPAEDPTGTLRAALERLLGSWSDHVPIALGWATVDLDRMERSFGEAYPGSVTSTAELGVDELLGARCRLVRPGVAGVPALVLLEPSTEGRLAAGLARHGEGPMAIWLESPADAAAAPGLPSDASLTPRRSVPAAGPFGTEVLLLDGPVHGPHRLEVLAGPGTITP